MNQPSDEALKKLCVFLLQTSVPRILEEERLEEKKREEKQNEPISFCK
ncbi:hypothetical protein MHH96_21145 [Niallia sp. FSL K6-0212]